VAEFFTGISALTVFLAIAAIGLLFLIASFAMGEVFDDIGFTDGGPDAHGFIDSRAVAIFITSFGGFGAIGIQMGLSIVVSSIMGLTSGIVLGGLVTLFGRFLQSQQASSSVGNSQLVGRTAQVTVKIPSGGIGQVSCRVGEERVEKLARSRGDVELKPGMLVRIEEIAGDSAIVSPAADAASYK
jgi:membrane protein implicated in regulation of membrane protease activity